MMLTRRRLRAMQDRWQRDYDTLEAAYGEWAPGDEMPYVETMRNLLTAIAMINGMIAARRRGDPRTRAKYDTPPR